MMKGVVLTCCVVFGLLLGSCQSEKKTPLFEIRTGSETGISFQNTITTNDTLNAVTYEYIYNGAGLGIGDFNNDGLDDVVFGGNQVSSALYLNGGDLRFRDVTAEAGLTTHRWVTGVSVIDINRDGLLDIYLIVAGKVPAEDRRNLLYINRGIHNGIPHFSESAAQYGLDDDRYGTMAAFFDFDSDGDQDLYLLNNWLEKYNRNNLRPKRIRGEAESTDRLYRNNGDSTFTDVSAAAGITIEGYGLGVAVCDINQDGLPDIYVSNDFMSNDLIWINQGNGTFVNHAAAYLKHQTHNGMGVDLADFNNDGLPDIIEVDMLPPGHKRQKLMTAGQNYDHFNMSLRLGYESQYMRNTLQLNRGLDEDGQVHFSEIAFLSGVAKTDWSWAPLFADFDNDGLKDIFIGNGYRKDVTNLDFVFFGSGDSPFGTPESRSKKYAQELEKLEEVKTTNQIFRNTSSLVFEDKTRDWGLQFPSYTNGAAYADLDNDGDLDLITNNIDQEVILYENTSRQRTSANHYIRLTSTFPNNEKIWVYAGGNVQYQELTPYRGFQSTVSPVAHFGLGTTTSVDSVVVEWLDGSTVTYQHLQADTTLLALPAHQGPKRRHTFSTPGLLESVPAPEYLHRESSESDIKITRTLMHELTRYGPCMAAGDVNNDLLDDLFIGGEPGNAGQLFIQNKDGTFTTRPLYTDSLREDGAALFFDVDGDSDADLYVAGACPSNAQNPSTHLLFINDGTGAFDLSTNNIPVQTTASCVEAADYDNDGDLDLFVGGRVDPDKYPFPTRSYVLRNDNGVLTDVTAACSNALEFPGLVSAAQWVDIDNDDNVDLVVAGEWMPIRIFRNQGPKHQYRFLEVTQQFGVANTDGWWNCLRAADLNHDGFVDLVAGNTGANSYFQPTLEEPVQIMAKDFDNNGSVDPIMSYYSYPERDRYMVHNRLVLIDQIPGMKKRFETFTQFATTPLDKAFTREERDGALIANAYRLRSTVLINQQGAGFKLADLPEIAQLSTINDILVDDLDRDGQPDLILIGNNYAQETLFGHYDASIGTILLGDGNFNWLPAPNNGFIADGDARYINRIRTAGLPIIAITNNDGPLQFFRTTSRR
jgi:hypothetical protein